MHNLSHTMASGHLRHSRRAPFSARAALCFGFGGLLLTFEQPFRLPGAVQAQGVLPCLNPHYKKKKLSQLFPGPLL